MNVLVEPRGIQKKSNVLFYDSLYNQQLAHQSQVFNSIKNQAYGGAGGYGGAYGGAGAGGYGGGSTGSYGGVGAGGTYG